jgi:alpha-glucosidase
MNPRMRIVTLALLALSTSAKDFLLQSPDGHLRAVVTLDTTLSYKVDYKGEPVILASRLGFMTDRCVLIASSSDDQNTSWKNPLGERSTVLDHFRRTFIDFASGGTTYRLECRAYNEGFAFRFLLPKQEKAAIKIEDDLTEFAFARDFPCWPVTHAQGFYTRGVTLSKMAKTFKGKNAAERPLVVETPKATVALGEAALIDAARMKFELKSGTTLIAHTEGPTTLAIPCTLPWRYVRIADNPCTMLEGNDLILNLNAPSAIKDTSWIKPGKAMREVTFVTEQAKACVDFCKKMNLQYIEFDAGWYGHEYDDTADARAVNLDPKRSKGPFDLPEVIRYAKTNNIDVWLYVNRRELEHRLDELLPLYKSWGVSGMKYGFINVGCQKWTAWASEAIRKAGEAGMMIDIHDEYRVTGNQRTWPNMLTVEGIAGNECMPTPEHNCALPFTRFLCGQADYTVCWTSDRCKTTRTHQLALPAIYFSPLQFLYWYDKPSMVKNDPALDFWKHIPTVWDDTKALNGKIGEYVTIARRSGEQWFVGSINANEARTLEIPLFFLTSCKRYTAKIYCEGATPKEVLCKTRTVTAADTLTAEMPANGGHAMQLTPQ